MNTSELLMVAAGAVIGATLVGLSLAAAAMRRRRAASSHMPEMEHLRRLARRIRQLDRIARRTEERLNGRMDELRRLLAQAEGVTAPRAAPPYASDGRYVGEPAAGERPSSEPGGPASPASTRAPLPGGLQKQRDQIFRLRFQGLETIDIARRLNLPVGEVELTLKLYREQQVADSPTR